MPVIDLLISRFAPCKFALVYKHHKHLFGGRNEPLLSVSLSLSLPQMAKSSQIWHFFAPKIYPPLSAIIRIWGWRMTDYPWVPLSG